MQMQVAFSDGFADDTAVIRVDGAEAWRADGLTTRTQISHAGSAQVEAGGERLGGGGGGGGRRAGRAGGAAAGPVGRARAPAVRRGRGRGGRPAGLVPRAARV